MDPLTSLSQHACMGGNRYRQQLELPAGKDVHEDENRIPGSC